MKRLFAVAVLVLIVLSGMGSIAGPEDGRAAGPQSLSMVVQRPGGPPVLLQFEVAAASAEEAYAAAVRAAAELVPGGLLAEPAGGVSAQFAFWGWKWDDAELPVSVAYNPTGGPDVVGPSVVVSALQAWADVPGSRFAFAYGGVTDRTASLSQSGPDGENVISWQSLDCSPGCVLGVTSKEQTHEVDMVLNSNPEAAAQFGIAGGKLDWKTVVLHETGHMAGLEHSCRAPFGACTAAEGAAVMYYQYRGLLRMLEPDDIAGMGALYPQTGPPPTPTTPPGGTVPEPRFVVLEGGWNLTVLPAGTVEDLANLLGCVRAIYRDDSGTWTTWIRGAAPTLQSLRTLEEGRAYWLLSSAPCAHIF